MLELGSGAGVSSPAGRSGLAGFKFTAGAKGEKSCIFLSACSDVGQKRKVNDGFKSSCQSNINNGVRFFITIQRTKF